MSKVQLAGNASGTGIFTIASPNSNTDRTLTLPDATGTVQLSGNPISGTTGTFSGLIYANGGGVQFPATQVASGDANTLDDYEEGTFTPILGGGSSNPTGVTYITQSGRYTKVGNLVQVFIYCAWSTYTSGSGSIQLLGLPFAAYNATPGYNVGSAECSYLSFPSGATCIASRTAPAQTYVDLQAIGASIPWTVFTYANMSSSASVKEILAVITYSV